MKRLFQILSAGLFLMFLVVSDSSRVYAEQKNGTELFEELTAYMEQNYQEIFAEAGYGEAAEDVGIGTPYYIYDESKAVNLGRYLYVPFYQENKIFLIIRLIYNEEEDSFQSFAICNHSIDILNELDYLNHECCVYRIGADIYAEDMNQWKLLYTETEEDEEAESLISNETQIDFQKYVYTIKLRHYKENLSWIKYGESDWEKEQKLNPKEVCTTLSIEAITEFMKEHYKEEIRQHTSYFFEFAEGYIDFTENEIDDLELGNPFTEYNVDGKQFAFVYFPLYKEGKAVGIIPVEYGESSYWIICSTHGLSCFSICQEELDRLDYQNEKVIFYTINNTGYAENRKIRIKLGTDVANEQPYSKEEIVFMKMSWKEKVKLVEEGKNHLCRLTTYSWLMDEDFSKQTTGGVIQEADKIPAPALVGVIILVVSAVGMMIVKKRA